MAVGLGFSAWSLLTNYRVQGVTSLNFQVEVAHGPFYKTSTQRADWPPPQTLRILQQQLASLQALKGRNHKDASKEENMWMQTTQAAMIHGFSEDSHNLSHFHSARWAGTHNMLGISDRQQQLNFEARIEKFEANILSSIAEVEVWLPQPASKGAYAAGDEFEFYKDLKNIVAAAAKDILIVDNYLNTEFFELYVEPVPAGVSLRILTDQLRGNLLAVAKKYATRGNFELRSSPDVHDRHIFVDGRGWMVGQSIKDAARKKPTYMVEIGTVLVSSVQKIYEDIWTKATVAVKS